MPGGTTEPGLFLLRRVRAGRRGDQAGLVGDDDQLHAVPGAELGQQPGHVRLAAAVFSGYTPLPWPGHPADPARMVASDLYVLFGLAVLGAVGVALARGRSPGPTEGP